MGSRPPGADSALSSPCTVYEGRIQVLPMLQHVVRAGASVLAIATLFDHAEQLEMFAAGVAAKL